MKRITLLALFAASLANAGVVKTVVNLSPLSVAKAATYPVRHPIQTARKALHVIW